MLLIIAGYLLLILNSINLSTLFCIFHCAILALYSLCKLTFLMHFLYIISLIILIVFLIFTYLYALYPVFICNQVNWALLVFSFCYFNFTERLLQFINIFQELLYLTIIEIYLSPSKWKPYIFVMLTYSLYLPITTN